MNPLYTSFRAHQEFGPAHSEDRRRGPDLHGVWRLLGDLARHHRQRSAGKRGVKDPFVCRRVECVAFDLQNAVRPDRQQRVVDERDSRGAVRSRDHGVGRLQVRPDVGGQAFAATLEVHRALGHFELGDISSECRGRRDAKRPRKHESTNVDHTSRFHSDPPNWSAYNSGGWPAPARALFSIIAQTAFLRLIPSWLTHRSTGFRPRWIPWPKSGPLSKPRARPPE